jgi:Flp pilus assembly pilin Flp
MRSGRVWKVATMDRITARIRRLVAADEGQDLLEYGLLAALIAVAAVASVRTLGDTILSVFWSGIGQAI